MATSPDGSLVVSCAADETLRYTALHINIDIYIYLFMLTQLFFFFFFFLDFGMCLDPKERRKGNIKLEAIQDYRNLVFIGRSNHH